MATPAYKGTNQPTSDGGWMSGMGSWFGASAPGYTAPASKPVAPATTTATPTVAPAVVGPCDSDRITVVIPRSLIGSRQLVVTGSPDGATPPDDAEHVTLVIPRSLIQSPPQQ